MSAQAFRTGVSPAAEWRAVTRTHVGLVRLINEDRLFNGNTCGVWAVVDGMGGHSGGDLAAQQVVDSLHRACSDAIGREELDAALQDANTVIHERNLRLHTQSGATVVATIHSDEMISVFWAGDSRAYWVDADGVRLLTRDHSLVQELVDAGMIDAAAAATHPRANVVTRALGTSAAVTLDRVTVPAGVGRLLLCSDGLSRTLSNDDLRHEGSVDNLADRLLAQALGRDGSDNVSFVLIEFG